MKNSSLKRLVLMIGTLIVATMSTAFMVGFNLYSAAVESEEDRLVVAAKSLASVISVSHRHIGEDSDEEILLIIQEAMAELNYQGFGTTGEIVFSRKIGKTISFISKRRHIDNSNKTENSIDDTLPLLSKRALPMRYALSGESGSVIGPDYRGVDVLAGYSPIKGLNWGVVVKIDLNEVQAPFDAAFLMGFALTLVTTFISAILIYAQNEGVINDLSGVTRKLQTELQRSIKLEQELKISLDVSKNANKAKSDFLSSMSHDLRTPLNAIIGFSEAISLRIFGPVGSIKYEEYAIDIHKSSLYLLELINDILNLSKLDAGKYIIDKESIDPEEAITECYDILSKLSQDKGVELSIQIPKGIPSVFADPLSLKKILINLTSNAIKYTPKGGNVNLSIQLDSKGHIFKVKDTGLGIPKEKIVSIVEPFSRHDVNPHHSEEGTGLGLSIVKSLVDLHDGNLEITSELHVGTSVKVTLPFKT